MRSLFKILVVILFFSCVDDKSVQKEKTVVSINNSSIDSINLVEELVSDLNLQEDVKDSSEECIFDQATQTDEFLKGIDELSDYVWFEKEKRAEITLSDYWDLSIIRGGCDHFELTAKFTYKGKLDFEKDKKLLFNKIVWITSLIEEFDGEIIERCLKDKKYSETKEDEYNYYVEFLNEKIYESYSLRFNNENNTIIEISYFIN